MSTVTPELIRSQAMQMRGVELSAQRSKELAADVGRLNEAVDASRDKLDFNDEPARFAALLSASAAAPRRRK